MTIVFIAVLLVTAFLYAGTLGCVFTLHSSDAAGNGLTFAFGVFIAIGLWVALAVLLILGSLKGHMPRFAGLACIVLHPLSLASALAAFELMRRPGSSAWPAVIPVLCPLLLTALAVVAVSVRTQDNGVAGFTCAGLAILGLLPWVALMQRSKAGDERRASVEAAWKKEQEQEERDKRAAQTIAFRKLSGKSPLWEWLNFADAGSPLRDEALARIRSLERRQGDAELMISRGFGNAMLELPNFDVQMTPTLCEGARKFLTERAETLTKVWSDLTTYDTVASRIEPYVPTIEWLVANRCDCYSEIAAIEKALRLYPQDRGRDRLLARLAAAQQSAQSR